MIKFLLNKLKKQMYRFRASIGKCKHPKRYRSPIIREGYEDTWEKTWYRCGLCKEIYLIRRTIECSGKKEEK